MKKILFDVGHPAHVNLFKNIISQLQKIKWEVTITVRDKDITRSLLDSLGYSYIVLSHPGKNFLQNLIQLIIHNIRMYKIVKKNKLT